jgi:tRNA nucleotidyltransferase (CCA-adding enzyme)
LEIQKNPAPPILMGRHLIELGLEPGKQFGAILDRAYDAQLEGAFHDLAGALRWIERDVEAKGHHAG